MKEKGRKRASRKNTKQERNTGVEKGRKMKNLKTERMTERKK